VPRQNFDDPKYTRICEVCGEPFQQKRVGQRTCSLPKTCRAQLPHNTGGMRIKAGLESRICQNPECSREFQPVRESQVACSRNCLIKCPSYRASQKTYWSSPGRKESSNRRRRVGECSDPDYRRFLNLRMNLKRSGTTVTWDEFVTWRARQDGTCKICGRQVNGKSAHTDHDHVTGRLRDQLCDNCNQGLGCFKDDPDLLRAAAKYIERHRYNSIS